MDDSYLTKQVLRSIEAMKNYEFDVITCLDRVRCMKEILREMPYMNKISRTEWQEMNCKLLRWEKELQDKLRVEV